MVGRSAGSRVPCAGDTVKMEAGSGWEGTVRSSVNLGSEGGEEEEEKKGSIMVKRHKLSARQ